MAVKDADPAAIELDEAFRAAMEAPAKPRTAEAPPEIDSDAPHGRDDKGEPLAPYGVRKDGKPKMAPGRRSVDAQPRVAVAVREPERPAAASGKPRGPETKPDYSEALSELSDAIWLGLTGLGMVGPQIPVVGKFLPGDKISAEAAIFKSNKDQLCAAVQLASEHSPSAARFCQKIAGGGPTWAAMCGFMVLPFLVTTSAVLRGDDALASMGLPDLEKLAAKNREDLGEFMSSMAGGAEAAADGA